MGARIAIARFAAGLAVALVAGCTFPTEQAYRDNVQSWVGRPADALVMAWGAPDRSYDFSDGTRQLEYDRQQTVSDRYFKLEDKCRALLNGSKWKEAEQACKSAVPAVEQLGLHQGLTKMGAYEHVGYSLLAQQRYQEALEYYGRAFDFAHSSLKETDAELGYAYRNLAMANHGLRNLDKARDLYGKAETTLQLAHENIEGQDLKQRYEKALNEILKYHLVAAEEAGAVTEAQRIRKRLEEKR